MDRMVYRFDRRHPAAVRGLTPVPIAGIRFSNAPTTRSGHFRLHNETGGVADLRARLMARPQPPRAWLDCKAQNVESGPVRSNLHNADLDRG
jgi:hypothetical protein